MNIVAKVVGGLKKKRVGDRDIVFQMGYALPNFPLEHPSIPVQLKLRDGQAALTGYSMLSYQVMSGKYDTLILPEKWSLLCCTQLTDGQVQMLASVYKDVVDFVLNEEYTEPQNTSELDEVKAQMARQNALIEKLLQDKVGGSSSSAASVVAAANANAAARPEGMTVANKV